MIAALLVRAKVARYNDDAKTARAVLAGTSMNKCRHRQAVYPTTGLILGGISVVLGCLFFHVRQGGEWIGLLWACVSLLLVLYAVFVLVRVFSERAALRGEVLVIVLLCGALILLGVSGLYCYVGIEVKLHEVRDLIRTLEKGGSSNRGGKGGPGLVRLAIEEAQQ